MIKFELTLESSKKVQIIAEEYQLHLAGIDKMESQLTETDIYNWITTVKTFYAKDSVGDKLLCVASKVETIRKIEPYEWFK